MSKLFKKDRIKELKKFINGSIQCLDKITMDYKNNIYHELGHVLERKTFENGKYIKKGIDDIIIVKEKEYFPYPSLNIDTKLLNDYYKREENNGYKTLEGLKIIGSNIISEVFNQEFTYITEDNLKIDKSVNKIFEESLFQQKSVLLGDSVYNIYYDIANLIKLACADINVKELKFNSKPFMEKLYNLNVDTDKLALFKDDLREEMYYSKFRDFINEVDNIPLSELKPFSFLSLIIGMSHFSYIYDNKQKIDDYKKIAQGILIESIKNDWTNKIYDNNVVKNEEFFVNLNKTLESIDDYILYPGGKTTFLAGDTGEEHEVIRNNITTFPVKAFDERYLYSHLRSFNFLIKDAELIVNEYKDKIDDLDEIMTFLNKQEVLKEEYLRLLKRDNEIFHALKTKQEWKDKHERKKIEKKKSLNLKCAKEETSYENEI